MDSSEGTVHPARPISEEGRRSSNKSTLTTPRLLGIRMPTWMSIQMPAVVRWWLALALALAATTDTATVADAGDGTGLGGVAGGATAPIFV